MASAQVAVSEEKRWIPEYFTRMFGMVWFGSTVSAMGDGFATVALGIWVLQATGSALAMSQIMLARSLVSILFGPIAGGVADRFQRQRLAVACQMFLTVAFLGVAWLMAQGGGVPLVPIMALLATATLLNSLLQPAMQASTVMIVGKDHLGKANSLLQLSKMAANILGPVLGGAAMVAFGGYMCMIINAVSFLIAGICIALAGRIPDPTDMDRGERKPPFWRLVTEGVRFLASDKLVASFVFLLAPMLVFFQTAIGLLFPTLAVISWKVSGVLFGVLDALFALGFVIGFSVMMKLGDKLRYRGLVFAGMVVLTGLVLSGMGFARNAYVVMPILLSIGILMSPANIVLQTVLQTKVPPEMQGRVFGVVQAAFSAATPLSLVLVGLASDKFGPGAATVAAGIGFSLVGLLAVAVPAVRRLY
jgi:DHA3 family macrolide efflux protein-like MFS transporter